MLISQQSIGNHNKDKTIKIIGLLNTILGSYTTAPKANMFACKKFPEIDNTSDITVDPMNSLHFTDSPNGLDLIL